MEDPVLNRNLDEIKELQTRWNQFHDFMIMAMQQGPAKITPQAEMKFLELKSRIAMLHDGFMGGVAHDVKTAQNIIQIVADAIRLKKAAGSSPAERQKFEFDWNECFMLINDTISSLDEEKKRLAGINERAYRMAQRRELLKAKLHNFLHHPALKWSVIIFAVLFATVGVQELNIYDYRNLYTIPLLKTPYIKIVSGVIRPFLAKELEFHDMDEVLKDDNAPLPQYCDPVSKPAPTPQDFTDTAMPALGLSSGLAEAGKLFSGRIALQQERFKLYNQIINISAVLFKTSSDAKRFVELVQTDVDAKSDAEIKKVKNRTRMMRNANLLIIGQGDPPSGANNASMRMDSKWKGEGVPNALK